METAFKARSRSSIKVPEGVPDWKHPLWRRVWRAAFLILQDEYIANKIANSVISPDSIKESFVAIPVDVPENRQKVWAKVYQCSKDVCGEPQIAKTIAYHVSGRKEAPSGVSDVIKNSSGKTMPANMQKSSKVKNASMVSNSPSSVLVEHRSNFNFQQVKEPPREAVKASDVPEEYQGWVEGYLISWGSTKDTDLQGEFFTPRTDLCLKWFAERPVLYHHGMDASTGLESIGMFKTIKTDDIGLWVQAQLDLRNRYARAVYDMVKSTQFGWSSGSVDHLVKIAENGEILVWPLIEGSITPTPAQPSKTAVRPVKGLIGQGISKAATLDAFKAVLTTNDTYADYLRGLEELNDSEYARVNGRTSAKTFNNQSRYGIEETMKPYSDSSWFISRAVAKAFGIKDVTEEELAAVAGAVNDTVEDEITVSAVKALHQEAENSGATQSYYGSNNAGSDRHSSVNTIKSNEATMGQNSYANYGDLGYSYRARSNAFRQADPAAVQGDVETIMANEIAAAMADEQMEAQAARALRRRAWQRAIRQITDAESPDGKVELGEMAMENPRPLASDTLPGSGKRYNAARQYMADPMAIQQDQEEALMADAMMQDQEVAAMADGDIADVATASYRRGFRTGLRSAYRQAELNIDAKSAENEAIQAEEEVLASKTDNGDVVDEAVRAYRAGYRRGLKRAIRQIEEETKSEDVPVPSKSRSIRQADPYRNNELPVQPAPTPTEYAQAPTGYIPVPEQDEVDNNTKNYNRRGMRQFAPAIQQDPLAQPATMQIPEVAAAHDEALAKFYARRAHARRQYMAEPTVMDDAVMQDEQIAAQSDPVLAKYYAARNNARRQFMADAMMQDPSVPAAMQDPAFPAAMQDPEFAATQGDPVLAKYYAARANARRQYMADAMMQDDPTAIMQDPELAATMQDPLAQAADGTFMADEGGLPMGKFYNQHQYAPRQNAQAYRSFNGAGNAYQQAQFWRQRALELEQTEAPGQRAFKSLQVKDVADRPGAYENAFKSYLIKGLGLMNDSEKYVLQGRGKARWENSTFAYDSATKSIKTYNSSSDASVGFLVPEDWVNELNKNVMTQTVMAPDCRTRTTTSDRIVQPNLITTDARRAHAAQVKWPGESPSANTEHRTTEDQYSQVQIPIHVMLISLAATNSALEDSTFNLEEEINEAFAEAVAVSYDQLIWGGDGQNKIQGIVVNEQVISSRSTGIQSVGGYVPTGSVDGIVTADVLKQMLFHLPQGYRTRAKWYMNSNVGLEIATLKDGEGNYLIDQRDESLRSVGIPDRLLGKPIVYNEWASDISSGSFPIVLADLSRGYVIGRRVEFSIRRFDDSNYAEHDQVLFLGRARLGGQVLQPAAFKTLKVSVS